MEMERVVAKTGHDITVQEFYSYKRELSYELSRQPNGIWRKISPTWELEQRNAITRNDLDKNKRTRTWKWSELMCNYRIHEKITPRIKIDVFQKIIKRLSIKMSVIRLFRKYEKVINFNLWTCFTCTLSILSLNAIPRKVAWF